MIDDIIDELIKEGFIEPSFIETLDDYVKLVKILAKLTK